MGKIHKDIAMFMVEAAKKEEYSDQILVKVFTFRLLVYLPSQILFLLDKCVSRTNKTTVPSWLLMVTTVYIVIDRRFSFERNCVLRRWESKTLK